MTTAVNRYDGETMPSAKMAKPVTAVNRYDGETKLKLYGIDYPMRWNARTYFQFKTETGIDPNALFMDVVNEINMLKSSGVFDDDPEIANSTLMARLTAVVSAECAVWLFYLAAKEMDKAVTFEEIQEAVLLEGVSQTKEGPDDELVQTYPHIVTSFAIFALGIGETDNVKKKPSSSGRLFIDRLRQVFSIQTYT